jgi:alpha-glucosidase
VSQLFEDPAYLQVPDKEKDLHLTYELIEKWRKFLDDYAERKNTDAKILVPQIWNSPIEDLVAYYQGDDKTQRAQVPMNFMLINELTASSTAADVKRVIDNYLKALPDGAVPNWFVSFSR